MHTHTLIKLLFSMLFIHYMDLYFHLVLFFSRYEGLSLTSCSTGLLVMICLIIYMLKCLFHLAF